MTLHKFVIAVFATAIIGGAAYAAPPPEDLEGHIFIVTGNNGIDICPSVKAAINLSLAFVMAAADNQNHFDTYGCKRLEKGSIFTLYKSGTGQGTNEIQLYNDPSQYYFTFDNAFLMGVSKETD